MADLIAQGADPRNRWRRTLPADRSVLVGRASTWPTPWDDRISRRHAELSWDGQRLHVTRLGDARNPVFFKGQASEQFSLGVGEHFVIGETTFTLASDRALVSLDVPPPAEEQAFSTEYLHKLPFRRIGPHIDVLGRLPEVIAGADSDSELSVRLVNLLLAGLPRAGAAALVARRAATTGAAEGVAAIDVLHWDRRQMTAADFQPSERLIRDALDRGESVLHVWNTASSTPASQFTVAQGIDWAFCTPVVGKACGGWALYVAGRFQATPTTAEPQSDPRDLRDDLKFTELAATTLGALCDVRMLERQRAGLAQFFAPPVLEAMQAADPDEVLAPREADVTVLFCDLRGFSRASERSAADLFGLLERVSRALGVATHQMQAHGGVLGDFHGDAAMGFWGWPLVHDDAALRAARTALAIEREFAAAQGSKDALADFQVGIGIAAGRAVAGKIGTSDQVKVTVFGPVVNLAARLESLTKRLQASILIDARVAAALRGKLPDGEGRLRRVAVLRPYGMEQTVEVVQLMPPREALSEAETAEYEAALEAFIAGRWDEAAERLRRVPASDRVQDFLSLVMAQHDRRPPAGWDGVVALTSK